MKAKAIIITIATLSIVTVGLLTLEAPHSEFQSPDKKYRAVVRTKFISGLFPAMPGQGSDSPGSITLYDANTGKNLGKRKLDMLQRAHEIEWTDDGAKIKFVPEWKFK